MKILITTDWYVPTVNGVVTSVLNLQKQLIARGHDVRILTLAQNQDSRHWMLRGGCRENVWYLPSVSAGKIYPGARVLFGSGESILREILAWKPEIVHSQCEFTTFWFARKIAKVSHAALCHTYHTVYEDYTHYFSPSRKAGKKAAALFSRWICGRTDAVIAPTEKTAGLLKKYRISAPVFISPTGIDCERYKKAHTLFLERAGRMHALKLSQGGQTLISVGRLAKEKNTEELLGLLADPRSEGLRLLLIGDGPHRPALEKQVRDLHLQERVFFAGMVSPEELPFWYQLGDIFVSASRSETQGLTYLEALASGLPLVCRRDPCLKGVVEDGVNGWQFDNADEFFSAILDLRRPEWYCCASDAALRSAKAFDSSLFAERILQVYEFVKKRKTSREAPPFCAWPVSSSQERTQ